jgi:hypothetical protein
MLYPLLIHRVGMHLQSKKQHQYQMLQNNHLSIHCIKQISHDFSLLIVIIMMSLLLKLLVYKSDTMNSKLHLLKSASSLLFFFFFAHVIAKSLS